MQEFIYYNPKGLDFPLNEEIYVTSNLEELNDKEFLVSNSIDTNSEVNAREIDFYIKNSKDDFSKKIKNVSNLYEIAATKYDYAQDISYSQEVSNQLLLVTNSHEQYDEFIS